MNFEKCFMFIFLVGFDQIFLLPFTPPRWLRTPMVIAVYMPLPLNGKAEFKMRRFSYECKDSLSSILYCNEPNQRGRIKNLYLNRTANNHPTLIKQWALSDYHLQITIKNTDVQYSKEK